MLRSFLQPADKGFPMVATQDIGRVAAALLREDWSGTPVVELEGPERVSPNDLARTFAKVLGRPVEVETVPHESWEPINGARNIEIAGRRPPVAENPRPSGRGRR